jgi:hypothetical protein
MDYDPFFEEETCECVILPDDFVFVCDEPLEDVKPGIDWADDPNDPIADACKDIFDKDHNRVFRTCACHTAEWWQENPGHAVDGHCDNCGHLVIDPIYYADRYDKTGEWMIYDNYPGKCSVDEYKMFRVTQEAVDQINNFQMSCHDIEVNHILPF